MSFPRQYPNKVISRDRVSLLAEVVEILVEELSAIGDRDWNKLPLLKKQKVVLAGRLHEVDWSRVPPEREAFDLRTLRALVGELERICREKVHQHMKAIDRQVFQLQDQHQYWRECLNVTFQPFYSAIPVG